MSYGVIYVIANTIIKDGKIVDLNQKFKELDIKVL